MVIYDLRSGHFVARGTIFTFNGVQLYNRASTKKYILDNRNKQTPLTFHALKKVFSYSYAIEQYIARKNGVKYKFLKKWELVSNEFDI
jgi:hypothetical protein